MSVDEANRGRRLPSEGVEASLEAIRMMLAQALTDLDAMSLSLVAAHVQLALDFLEVATSDESRPTR